MIATPRSTTLSPDRVTALGYCPDCYTTGTISLVVAGQSRCHTHLVDQRLLVEFTGAGQARLAATSGTRRRPVYPTGLQTPCVPCAAAGRDKQGLPRDGEGSEALCWSCWRSRTDRQAVRQRQRLVAELRERLDVDEPAGCAACGEPEPVPTCWLCGYSWLAQARADHEHAVALEAAATAARFAQLAEVTEARERVDALTAWTNRLTETVTAFQIGESWGRPVWLLADALARDAAARVSRRGRRSALGRVCAVLAVNADRRSGRRAMPGRAETAELAGCDSTRPVTDAWRRAEALGWCTRTEQGRRLSYAERCATGRAQARATFDITPLHRGPLHHSDPAARTAYLADALDILAGLLEHARGLLAAAQERVDALEARAGGWIDYREQVRRRRMRQAVAGVRDQARHQATNFRTPHTVSSTMSVYSCLSRGLLISPSIASAPSRDRQSRRKDGASRSSTRSGVDRGPARSHAVQRPRPAQSERGASPAVRPRPEWSEWAYDLARAVQARWVWLRGASLPRVAATLGAALGPNWTAEALDAWVRRARPRPLLVEPDSPVGYLRAVLEDALTGPVAPPHPARRHAEHRRALVATQAAAQREHQDVVRAGQDDRDQAAVQPGRRSPAAEAALAAIRARTSGHLRRTDRAALLDTTAAECEWPEVAQPGAGLPPALRP
ncbi:hypothetical protein ACFY2R_18135 [Micromonospora olivasterospora]|uniref:Uncharacterized protein n=1 Tax=Micromonospora olivasterospora TaxID=1880 RepID=A0A562HU49_MICOL|nr:hypothetical protein [Micromonospora olivasterospora]TWH62290.1 hypothetical protein JD77_06341 [Micromonospora olivasterospora]